MKSHKVLSPVRFSRPNCRFSSRLIALVVALALFGAGPSDARPQEGRFRRGDVDGDARVTISDAISTLGALFLGKSGPACADAADANDDGRLDLSDAIKMLQALFGGGIELPAPGMNSCGVDPTQDSLSCEGQAACAQEEEVDEEEAPVEGETVVGRILAAELDEDGQEMPLEGVVVTVMGLEDGEAALRAVTDAAGEFELQGAPEGELVLRIDARGVSGEYPEGAYRPVLVAPGEAVADVANDMGDIIVPLLPAGTLQSVNEDEATVVELPEAVLESEPGLEGAFLMVPAGQGGRVGIAAVYGDEFPYVLPESGEFDFLFAIESDSAETFQSALSLCLPNLPEPMTGELLPAGSKSVLWRYRPEAGDFIQVAKMTVSADGWQVCTDQGEGIARTGWHSVSAASLNASTRSQKARPRLPGQVKLPSRFDIPNKNPEAPTARVRKVIVLFDDQEVQRQANDLRVARGAKFEDAEVRALKVEAFAAIREQFKSRLGSKATKVVKEFKHIPMAYVEVSNDSEIAALEAQPGVVGVFEEMMFEMHLAQTLPLIGQPTVVASGLRGAGTSIAIIDTGVDLVNAFGICPGRGCRVVSRQDFSAPDRDFGDNDGHGTNVAAIAAAVAPGAGIIGIDVFDFVPGASQQLASFIGIVSALDWVIDNRSTFNIVALNMSLGTPIGGSSTTCFTPFDFALMQARQAGIAPVVSAGNDSNSNLIGTPGCSAFAISVGAVGDNLVPAGFSNSGPGLELWAPGRNVTAGGITMSGTSQAAPHVAGAFAVLAALNPGFSVNDILDQLQSTGTPITRNGVTRPFIRLDIAATFAPILDNSESGDRFGHVVATGDFNGDGLDDLAIGVPNERVNGDSRAGAVNVIYGTADGLRGRANQFWHQDSPGIPGLTASNTRFGASLAAGDFNGDGRDDLAIGAPGDFISGHAGAGSVFVIYGTSNGLGGTAQMWHQNSSGINGVAEFLDHFGASLAAGDFNNDGRDDLAIGVPDEDIGAIVDAGAVNVIYGTSNRLSSTNDQDWHQNRSGINDACELFDHFGFSLAAGDFNRDGRDDLAIGVPNEDIGFILDAGAVNVIYGSSNRLSSSGDQFWHQDSRGINGRAELFDHFGFSLAAGDFNGGGHDDLAIGVPHEDIGLKLDTGVVNVIYGTSNRLSSNGDQIWDQDSPNVNGVTEPFDNFGRSLTAGDFNGDGRDDLAIGVPFEDVGSIVDGGVVNVLYGASPRLSSINDQDWHQDKSGVNGVVELFDRFGMSVASGDFDGDGRDDLAIGVPDEDIGSIGNTGVVSVLYGTSNRLSSSGDQDWHQNK